MDKRQIIESTKDKLRKIDKKKRKITGFQSVYWSLSVLCLYLYVGVLSQIKVLTKNYIVSGFSKLDALLHKTQQSPSGTKVPRLNMSRSIISLRTHKIWGMAYSTKETR